MNRFALWTSASLLMFLGCGQSSSTGGHTVLAKDLSALRSRFNADSGKVRAIFLAAPT